MTQKIVTFIQDTYATKEFIPLHAPQFTSYEREYVANTIDSTFVSTVGQYVGQFENEIKEFTKASSAVATVNGTAALHCALKLAGVASCDLVITQALSFVASCNAIHYCGAKPVFVDVDLDTMGLSPEAASQWLEENAIMDDEGQCIHKSSKAAIKAVLPMHTFGHPVRLQELTALAKKWNLTLIEDAAEALGSLYHGTHVGNFGRFASLSFNGNKIITTGGGGMIMCRDEEDGRLAKHITTTAKVPHDYEFFHDEVGYNYRMPNINAALGCGQMKSLETYLAQKRALAIHYSSFFTGSDYEFVKEPDFAKSNYWLNAVICADKAARDNLLHATNEVGVMTRPIWHLLSELPMFQNCLKDELLNSVYLCDRVVNIPSSPIELES